MLDHISIGVRDMPAAIAFYRAVLAPLGYSCLTQGDDYAGFGAERTELWLGLTQHPVPADPRSGLHVSFHAPSAAAVDGFHAAALAHGGSDNGAPGLRADYGAGYYAAFAIDPDGYRIEAHFQDA
jgi:catechol 2,3-dioxygenase-like lactoylglutathione lyase family enzyme